MKLPNSGTMAEMAKWGPVLDLVGRLQADLRAARANALILAHSYTHDNTPPSRVVAESLAYRDAELAERTGAK